ncbi:hypothetical protein OIV83_001015 [Microbotryomycetes sp. JL201]|nr:hypothetical protein OIV83_001015 [Microbotryomycetes sp. JL201]
MAALRRRYAPIAPELTVDHLVIGAGVVGLAIAERLTRAFADKTTFVVERHGAFGQETSARNSEVIHSGIYYPAESLKTKLCIRGRDMMYDRCTRNGISHRKTGKLIVATADNQKAYLRQLEQKSKMINKQGTGNVPLTWLSGQEARRLEPDLGDDIVGALLSPETGIVSSHELMEDLENSIIDSGTGELVYGTRVVRIDRHEVRGGSKRGDGSEDGWAVQTVTNDGKHGDGERSAVLAKTVINAAGLNAHHILNQIMDPQHRLQQHFAKGSYFSCSVQHLLYPCPDPTSLAGLGTHLTMNLSNEIRFGPDVEWLEPPRNEDGEDESDFWERHLSVNEDRLQAAIKEVKRFLPGVRDEGFQPDYVGIRPKLSGKGEPSADFSINLVAPAFISLNGIESPGLTSSLAIAEYVENMVKQDVWGLGRSRGKTVSECWSASNLYNLYQRTYGPPTGDTNFTKSSKTLFQQKWKAKQLVRAYHGDWLQEQKFKRHFLPDSLPPIASPSSSSTGRPPVGARTATVSDRVPLASMMFSKLERRIDTVVFRCCFAHSVYRARQMVIHGKVKLNGRKVKDANILLKPGDLISVDPEAVSTLKPNKTAITAEPSEKDTEQSQDASSSSETDASAAAEPPSSTAPQSSSAARGKKPLRFELPEYASPFLFVPAYLEVSWTTCSAVYLRDPSPGPGMSEVPSPYEADGEVMRLAWEYYVSLGRRGDKRPTGLVGKRSMPHPVHGGTYGGPSTSNNGMSIQQQTDAVRPSTGGLSQDSTAGRLAGAARWPAQPQHNNAPSSQSQSFVNMNHAGASSSAEPGWPARSNSGRTIRPPRTLQQPYQSTPSPAAISQRPWPQANSASNGLGMAPSTRHGHTRPPARFQLSDTTAPVLPMSRVADSKYQAMYTTLPARMRLGTCLLMQPVVDHDAVNAAHTTAATAAASAAALSANHFDGAATGETGSGHLTPSGMANSTGRRTRTAVNYAELEALNSHVDDDPPGTNAYSNQRSRRDSTVPAQAYSNGTPGPVQQPEPKQVWGDGKSYLGQMPPGNLVTVQLRGKTKHPYFSEDQLETQAKKTAVYVPIDIDLDIDGFRIRDSFVWNAREELVSIMDFSKIMCDDLDIPQTHAPDIASQISEQLAELVHAAEIQVRSHEEEKAHADRDLRVMLPLDVQIGALHLVDRVEWDLTSSLTPEMFARVLASDLSLPYQAVPTIAHALHAEILRAKRILEPTGLLVPLRLTDDPQVDAQQLVKRRGPKALEGAWREWHDAGPCGPKIDLLSLEEVEKLLASKDKERK